MSLKPQKLKKGDTIGIIAPSGGNGALFPHRVKMGIKALEELGFKVKVYPTSKKIINLGISGSEKERLKDIHDAFLDEDVKAIICNIGGISANEIMGKLDFDLIKSHPKIFSGYSDISLLHHAILKKTGLVTFYGPCLMTQFAEFPSPLEYTLNSFLEILVEGFKGEIKASEEWTDEVLDWSKKDDLKRPRKLLKNEGYEWIKDGNATAKIIGGCLYSLLQLKGTSYEPDYKDKILFIETPEGQTFRKGEPLEYINAQVTDLKNSGVFDKIKGLIVGRGFGYTVEERLKFKEIISNKTKEYDFPVLFNANIGHADPIITLPFDVSVTLDSSKNLFRINEPGVE
ncbi:MAG: S66 peptidase family protein [Nanoarchaeota archaeon]